MHPQPSATRRYLVAKNCALAGCIRLLQCRQVTLESALSTTARHYRAPSRSVCDKTANQSIHFRYKIQAAVEAMTSLASEAHYYRGHTVTQDLDGTAYDYHGLTFTKPCTSNDYDGCDSLSTSSRHRHGSFSQAITEKVAWTRPRRYPNRHRSMSVPGYYQNAPTWMLQPGNDYTSICPSFYKLFTLSETGHGLGPEALRQSSHYYASERTGPLSA